MIRQKITRLISITTGLSTVCLPGMALAADAPELNVANTAWMLTSTVLVLFMTIPGLALLYAGLVRTKNVFLCSCNASRSLA